MSTPPPTAAPVEKPDSSEREIRIISHSNLFYWWPIWAIGLLMGILTWIDGGYMVVVPTKDVTVTRTMRVEVENGKLETREGLYLPQAKSDKDTKDHLLPVERDANGHLAKPDDPHILMARHGAYGIIFLSFLLLVIVITNVPLRGMWSVVIIVTAVLLCIILALARVGTPPRSLWEVIIEYLWPLDIRINMAGYFFVSLILFAIWLITFLFFDQQTYIVFTPGQLKVRTEIGGGEKAYDTSGMTVEKQRSDLFRHWILGLGSGDLVVNTTGAGVHHFDLPNVLFIGRKVQQIEDMLREKRVVA